MVSGSVLILGVSDKVPDWVVKEFRLSAYQARVLSGNFEEDVKRFQGVEQRVQETCGGKRQGGAGFREKERTIREAATAHSKKAQGVFGADACSMGGGQKAPAP